MENIWYDVIIDLSNDEKALGYRRERWFHADQLHCDHGPSVRIYDPKTGALAAEEWWLHGMRHRIGAPAVVWHNPWKDCEWYENGELHRADGPALLHTDLEGIAIFEEWRTHGKLHRVDGPAEIARNAGTGQLLNEAWYLNGVLHRADGPGRATRNDRTGVIEVEEWFFAGKLHRQNGPAYIQRDCETGQIINAEFYENGLKRTSCPSLRYEP